MEEDEKGYSPELWQKMADLGWLGLVFPTEYSGTGMTFVELVVLLEEMGRACLPSPFCSTVVGGMTILDIGSQEQKARILPEVSQGRNIITLALEEPSLRYNPAMIATKAVEGAGSYVVTGTKLFVPYAHVADLMICVAKTSQKASEEALTFFLVDGKCKGVNCNLIPTIPRVKNFSVTLNSIVIPEKDMLGALNQGWSALKKTIQRATIAKCAEMVGGAQQILEMTIDYAKQRVQFGRPIGSFQSVHNRLVDMVIGLDGTRYLTYQAAIMLSQPSTYDRYVSMAKAWASNAYKQAALSACIIHGGLSATIDSDIQLYFRRAQLAKRTFGDSDFHRSVIADDLVRARKLSIASSR
jgi:alkylation response protein AidB-like acyl-CoA dehydrogenase